MTLNRIGDFIDHLQSQGRYTFTRDEVEAAFDKSSLAIEAALRRLKKKGRIANPRQGFHIIIPLEYRPFGSMPAIWFIDELMAFLEQPYYVGLLSAAALHGAAHQRPQVFQVMTDVLTRRVEAGRVRIEFHTNRHLEHIPTVQMQSEAGYLTVATPEATAVDLVRYMHASGGLNNIATVLQELAEQINPEALAAASSLVEQPIAQRLGYVLDAIGQERITIPLSRLVTSRRSRRIPLRPDLDSFDADDDNRWNVILNDVIESDL